MVIFTPWPLYFQDTPEPTETEKWLV